MKSFDSLERFVLLSDLLDRVENDEDLLVELLTLFLEDLPESRAALEMTSAEADMPGVERAAHRLKGMLANLSAQQTAVLAAGIESAARAGDSDKVRQDLATLESQLTALSLALNSFLPEKKD